ncbi:Lea domain protein [Rhizoctonia solani]|uniref:Lea domain protein n=1 Tax=Rhizoctonia solani TaxID=456999 RepID=A0A8H7IBK3_9AGAM|nr:Lea domain protein [Rhizoctonia solani]
MSNTVRIPDAPPPGWHSIRPWIPRLSLYVHEITSVSVTFILSCRSHIPDSPSIEEELGEKLADMKHKISDVLGKGLAVKVNNAPWQRVVMHVDEESDEEAVVILYGLMPSKHYEIELSVVAGESIKGNLTTEDELSTDDFDESTRAPPAVTQLNTTHQTQTVTPADTPPSSPSTTAQLKTARRDAQRADAALRSEIEALKRAMEKNAAGEQRTKQKILALQESVKQALAAAVDADNEVKELERALPGLEAQRDEAEKEHTRASEAADRSTTEAKAALEQDRKRTAEVEVELTALTAKVEKMTAKRDKLATENIPELERELSSIRAEIEEIEREKEREREFNHEIDYPHHYAPQQLMSRINVAAPPFVPRNGVGHSRGAASVPAVQTGPMVKPHTHTASEGFLRGYPPLGPAIDIPSQRPSGAQPSPTATENRAIGPTGTTSRKGSLPPGAERGWPPAHLPWTTRLHLLIWAEGLNDAPSAYIPSICPDHDVLRNGQVQISTPPHHRQRGPGLILILPESYPSTVASGSGKHHLDPLPAQKWAEEGFCVLSVPASKNVDWQLAMPIVVAALEQAKDLEKDKAFGLIVYESDLVNAVLQHVSSAEKISCIVAYANSDINASAGRPLLQHIASGTATPNKESSATLYRYALSGSSFVHPCSSSYNHTQATLAHTRTLTFLRTHIGGPVFDLESIWEAHTQFEFEGRDVDATMSTMVAEPYVNHIPTLTGGIGRKALTWFYARHFIHSNPDSTKMELVSRTLGPDRVVDEFVFEFVHDRVMDWILPGIPPTGKYVKVPFVAVVNIRGDKLYHEHIYWDQASVLVQIGLLPEKLAFPGTTNEIRLPVAGIEQAEKMADPRSKQSNHLIKAGAPGRI